jgi:putative Holliday junction resolvase
VDWGERRIGLAVSDPTQTLAQPLATLTRRAGKRFPMRKLRLHLDEIHPVGIVVGLPLGADAREGDVDQLAATVLLQTFLDHRQ